MFTTLNQYHVVLEVEPQFQYGPEALNNIYVKSSSGQQVPLGTLVDSDHQGGADRRQPPGPVSLGDDLVQSQAGHGDRSGGRRHPGSSKSEIGKPLRCDELSGQRAGLPGVAVEQPILIAAALFVIYIILGVLYESLIHPITILSTLPSAGIGALLMLMAVHLDLSVIAIIGIILLIGIVKKNGIMLVDFALDAERERQASTRRSRSIRPACCASGRS